MSKKLPSLFGGWSAVKANLGNIKQSSGLFSPKTKKTEKEAEKIENEEIKKNPNEEEKKVETETIVSKIETLKISENSSQENSKNKSTEETCSIEQKNEIKKEEKENYIPKKRIVNVSSNQNSNKRKSIEYLQIYFKETIETSTNYEKLKKERIYKEKITKNRRKSREIQTKMIKNLFDQTTKIEKKEQETEEEFELFSSPKKLKLFEKYIIERQLTDQFQYYNLYLTFKKEKDDDLKEQLSKQLYQDFIDPSGINAITLYTNDLKKIKKFNEKKSSKGFELVFRHVRNVCREKLKIFILGLL